MQIPIAFVSVILVALLLAACPDRNKQTDSPPASRPHGSRQVGTPQDDLAAGIAVDSSGNVYVVGTTLGQLEGQTNTGGRDLFIIKYDAAGLPQWTRQFGTPQDDEATGIVVDTNGQAYVTGFTLGAFDGVTNAGGRDLLVIKYDGSGNQQWTRQTGTVKDDEAHHIAIHNNESIYLTGHTFGRLGSEPHAGHADPFLIKYAASGEQQWIKQPGQPTRDYGEGVAVDAAGNVYFAGLSYGQMDGAANAGLTDLFVSKYAPDGTRFWTQELGTEDYDAALRVAVDASANIFVTGYTFRALDGQPHAGLTDIFVVKYDSAGVKQWTRLLGTPATERAQGLAVDPAGNVYVAGLSLGELDGHSNQGDYDAVLVKYDTNGAKQWSRQFGTAAMDRADGIAIDLRGHVYIVGTTNGRIDGLAHAGGSDLFVTAYDFSGDKLTQH